MKMRLSPALALALIGGALLVLTALGLTQHTLGEVELESAERRQVLVALCSVAAALYLVAVAIVLRRPLPRRALWGILLCAGLMRLILLPSPPFLSTDIYRYVWDGKVQVAGISPYRYIPDAPELRELRDKDMFPKMNRADYAHTIYPPMAQIVFYLAARISPTVIAMKATMVGFEALAIFVVLRLLAMAGLPRERVLIYAWNPLPVWEFAGNGHVDAIAIGLIAVAMLFYLRGQRAFTGAVLGAAILVKFLPVALFPAFWRRWDARMPAACLGAIALLYLLYIGAGRQVLGFLPNYATEEGFRTGLGFYYVFALDHLVHLSQPAIDAVVAVAAAALLGLGSWIAFARETPAAPRDDVVVTARNVLLLSTGLMLAITPHFAWYYAWLALPACLYPSFSVLYLTAASFLLNFDPGHEQMLWRGLMFGPFVLFAVLEYRWRRKAAPVPLLEPLRRT